MMCLTWVLNERLQSKITSQKIKKNRVEEVSFTFTILTAFLGHSIESEMKRTRSASAEN